MTTASIDELLKLAAEGMLQEFELLRKTMHHHGTAGEESEEILIKFFNSHLPRRFAASSGFVIDTDNIVSRQCDVLIYDAENSPVYRVGNKGLILPSDSVAATIEVKSKLNKEQLKDAADKIASVKRLKRTPVSNADQPVTFSELIVSSSYGIVFAYDSETSLISLAENLKEINKTKPRSEWIDIIVVLGKGVITYSVQFPGEIGFRGLMMPVASEGFSPPAIYVHLIISNDGKYALNRLFGTLVTTLSFFRKKTAISLDAIMKGAHNQAQTIQGYWYNTKNELTEVPEKYNGAGPSAEFEFNVRVKNETLIIAHYACIKWSDGFIYRFTPFSPQSMSILKELIKISRQKNVITLPNPGGAVIFTSVLKGDHPTLDEIKKHIEKQTDGTLEVV